MAGGVSLLNMSDAGRHSAKMAARMVIPAKTLWANNFSTAFPNRRSPRSEVRRLEFPKA
jgi:hypothetical protein